MELLTESTMHAFEASAKTYKPDRIAANYPPGCVPRPGVLYRADADRVDNTAVLLRTLERSADMLPEGVPLQSPTVSPQSPTVRKTLFHISIQPNGLHDDC
jgi:hypothetical protein